MIKIYYLETNGEIFYVGKTKNTLPYRLAIHKFLLKKKEITNVNIHLIDDVDLHNWKFWETFWINQFKQWGFNLINKNNGGGGPTTHAKNTIYKIIGNKDYKEIGKKISKSKKGSKYNITIKGNKHALFGKTQNKETIEKKIKSLTGQIKSPYKTRKDKGVLRPHVSNTNHYLYGKNMNESHILNKSKAALGNKNRSKLISQYTIDDEFIKTFESAAEAERQLNIKGIRNVCCGISKTAGGFKWKYE